MKKELSAKPIFDDFKTKVILTDLEVEVLTRYIRGNSIVKIADEVKQSTSTISRTIANLKDKYSNYKRLELAKLMLFKRE